MEIPFVPIAGVMAKAGIRDMAGQVFDSLVDGVFRN